MIACPNRNPFWKIDHLHARFLRLLARVIGGTVVHDLNSVDRGAGFEDLHDSRDRFSPRCKR